MTKGNNIYIRKQVHDVHAYLIILGKDVQRNSIQE